MTTRTVSSFALLSGVLPLLAIVGCGGNETTASKSAAAYEDAERKGAAPASGGAHGGHGGVATSPMPGGPHAMPAQGSGAEPQKGAAGAAPSSMDHSKMAGMDKAKAPAGSGDAMKGMDHSKMAGMDKAKAPGGSGDAMKGMDHSKMAGMDKAKAPAGSGDAMKGMDHSKMAGMDKANAPAGSGTAMKGMDHSKMAGMGGSAMAMPPPQPEPPSTTAKPGQPAATLRPDDIDAPAPTSLDDAGRSAAMAQEMSGGHGMQHGTYRQIDAGRDSVAPKREEGHEGHGAAPQPQASPKADPHQMHSAPAAPTPAPSMRAPQVAPPAAKQDRKTPPRAQPSPSPDPHQMHTAPASPRPSPTPGVKDENR